MKLTPCAHVLAELHQVVLVRLLQQLHPLGDVDRARVAVARQRVRAAVEGHADVLGRVAVAAHVLHLVAAVAHADAAVRRGLDDLARALVVEHVQRVVVGEHRLVDEHSAKLRLAVREQRLDEVLFDVEVLVEQLAEQLLVHVVADAHHRELEEAGHRRRQHVGGHAVALGVHEDGSAGELVEHRARLGEVELEDLAGLLGGEGLDGELGDDPRLALAQQHREDLEQRLGLGRALREPVEPVDHLRVAGLQRGVGHADLRDRLRQIQACLLDGNHDLVATREARLPR